MKKIIFLVYWEIFLNSGTAGISHEEPKWGTHEKFLKFYKEKASQEIFSPICMEQVICPLAASWTECYNRKLEVGPLAFLSACATRLLLGWFGAANFGLFYIYKTAFGMDSILTVWCMNLGMVYGVLCLKNGQQTGARIYSTGEQRSTKG